MTIDELVERYRNDFFFRIKQKAKHFSKFAGRVAVGACMVGAFVYTAKINSDFSRSLDKSVKVEKCVSASKTVRNSALAWMLATAVGSYALLNAYDQCRKKTGNPFVNHNTLSTVVLSLSVGLTTNGLLSESPKFASVPQDVKTNVLICYTAFNAYIINWFLSEMKKFRSPHFTNWMKTLYLTAPFKKGKYSVETALKLKEMSAFPSVYDDYVSRAVLDTKESKALFDVQKTLEQLVEGKKIQTNFGFMKVVNYAIIEPSEALIWSLKKKTAPAHSLVGLAKWHYSNGNYENAFEAIKQLGAIAGMEQDCALLYTLFADKFMNSLEKHPENFDVEGIARLKLPSQGRLWTQLLDAILKNPKTTYSTVHGERVKAFSSSEFMGKTLLAKIGNRAEFEDERDICLQAERVCDDELAVLKPLAIVDHDGKAYYAMVYKHGLKSLFEAGEVPHFERAARFLRLIHDNVKSSKGNRDYRKIVEQRILSSHFGSLKQIVEEEEWNNLWNSAGPYVFDKDPHGGQWLCSQRKLFGIDFTDKGNVQRGFQLNKLVVESSLKGNDEIAVLKAYDVENLDSLRVEYWNAMIPSALSYLCFPVYKGMDVRTQQLVYLENARMAAFFVRAEKLKKIIEKIII